MFVVTIMVLVYSPFLYVAIEIEFDYREDMSVVASNVPLKHSMTILMNSTRSIKTWRMSFSIVRAPTEEDLGAPAGQCLIRAIGVFN